MQETTLSKTPAQELLDLLLATQKFEQHYSCKIEFEKDYTVLTLFNKEHYLYRGHMTHPASDTTMA